MDYYSDLLEFKKVIDSIIKVEPVLDVAFDVVQKNYGFFIRVNCRKTGFNAKIKLLRTDDGIFYTKESIETSLSALRLKNTVQSEFSLIAQREREDREHRAAILREEQKIKDDIKRRKDRLAEKYRADLALDAVLKRFTYIYHSELSITLFQKEKEVAVWSQTPDIQFLYLTLTRVNEELSIQDSFNVTLIEFQGIECYGETESEIIHFNKSFLSLKKALGVCRKFIIEYHLIH